MNKGTKEGTDEEIKFVRTLNKDKVNEIWSKLIPSTDSSNDFYMIHVCGGQYGKINSEKIKPKADVYVAKGHIEEGYLKKKNYYLDEKDVDLLGLSKCDNTGISIKRTDSSQYQIMKISPNTFKKLFGSFELGAGASIFCKRTDDLEKNGMVLKGWNTNWKEFEEYFNMIGDVVSLKDPSKSSEVRLKIAKKVKDKAAQTIKDKIDRNKWLSDFVFKGVGNFDEPYTIHWIYVHGIFKQAGPEPFKVTTGSGRTHGDFTIVIKPI